MRPNDNRSVDKRSNGPPVGVLGQLNINVRFTVPPSTNRPTGSTRPDRRQRITQSVRDEVVHRYVSENQTALEIAEECGIGKTTVLKILRDGGVPVRPRGQKRL